MDESRRISKGSVSLEFSRVSITSVSRSRAALYVVEDAEKRGLLTPGGTVVEGTAGILFHAHHHNDLLGNTGIGLAHVCRSKGYKWYTLHSKSLRSTFT